MNMKELTIREKAAIYARGYGPSTPEYTLEWWIENRHELWVAYTNLKKPK